MKKHVQQSREKLEVLHVLDTIELLPFKTAILALESE